MSISRGCEADRMRCDYSGHVERGPESLGSSSRIFCCSVLNLSFMVAMLSVIWAARLPAAELPAEQPVAADRVTFRPAEGPPLTVSGTISSYDSQGCQLTTAEGLQRSWKVHQLVKVEPRWPQGLFPERLPDGAELIELIDRLKTAYQRESEPWRRQFLLAQASRCYWRQGDWSRAAAAFLEITRSDMATPHWNAAPLVWALGLADTPPESLGRSLLEMSDNPAAQLLGASWIGPLDRQAAQDHLESLTADGPSPVAQLARWQLRRLQTTDRDEAPIRQWELEAGALPQALQGGPWLVVARRARRGGAPQTALYAALRAGYLHADDARLAPQALLIAQQLLEQAGRQAEAAELANRLKTQYPHSLGSHSEVFQLPDSQ